TGHARDRRLAGEIAVGEGGNHRALEPTLVIEDIMGDAERRGDAARIMNILAGTAASLASRRDAVIVELERNADDIVALSLEQGRDDRRVDTARHGHDDSTPRATRRGPAVRWRCRLSRAHV